MGPKLVLALIFVIPPPSKRKEKTLLALCPALPFFPAEFQGKSKASLVLSRNPIGISFRRKILP